MLTLSCQISNGIIRRMQESNVIPSLIVAALDSNNCALSKRKKCNYLLVVKLQDCNYDKLVMNMNGEVNTH